MLFSSLTFIFMFLPLLIIVYYFSKKTIRNYILLVFSLVFYAWGEPVYIIIMLLSIAMNYSFALLISRAAGRKLLARLGVTIAIVCNLSILAYFKYAGFLIDNLNRVLAVAPGSPHLSGLSVVMPIGISFFTFQALSYVIDVYRQRVSASPKITSVALYISLFPQLIAGPIVRYIDIEKQIDDREFVPGVFAEGIRRFIVGLGKKVLIANTVALVADNVFALPGKALSTPVSWIGILCYTVQIYFDFSGYSDMAIGLGKMFGFSFLENFNFPYIAKSITDFWRRWHISLSTWFRDYVYIPLGGNRKGKARTYVNLVIVFFVTGLWHGASWHFVVWGMFHGFFLVMDKLRGVKTELIRGGGGTAKALPKYASQGITLLIVIVGWVLFRSETLAAAMTFLSRMFALTRAEFVLYTASYYINGKLLIVFAVAVLSAFGAFKNLKRYLLSRAKHTAVVSVLTDCGLILILLLSVITLSSSSYNPFIYFRF